MNEVAKRAGVSQTTVSFVVNQVEGANIPPETQERVWAAVKELGYRPNVLARGLRSNRTHAIGFVTDEIATTPFAGKILEGAQTLAWDHEYVLLLVNTGGNQKIKKAAVNMMLDRQVDGIIYATMYHRPVDPPANLRDVPAVLLDCYVEDRSLPSVVPDEAQGGYTATEHLLKHGHRRVGFINNLDSIPATFGRLSGYKQALDAYDIAFDETLIHAEESEAIGGYRAIHALMRVPDPPTAIFCFNDRMAMGAYNALQELNLSIPNEVAIIGFDNQELIAANLYPSLTTVALPHAEMGRWAVRHLLELIDQSDAARQSEPVQHLMTCPLIERASV
ncbi:MAG: LacI family DNA-binding transcriptional regulator [Anaerolineaceae bacterium]|nr:LacI family DNA-binding transcriptional regulator [Anaerolineaceae bacterium]